MSSRHRPGRHELGQNYLTDRQVIRRVVQLTAATTGPIVEWAAGSGALTAGLAGLDRPLEAVEIDPRNVARLRRTARPHVCVTEGDILRHAPPAVPYTLVSNVPFHITTAVMRRLLALSHWHDAILITQWEVARKRAGVGGATQLTAQWWPWYEFELEQRIPAAAFVPRPSVDAGLLVIRRRPTPLLTGDRVAYQRWVGRVFASRGRGLPDILARAGIPPAAARRWCAGQHLDHRNLPRDLTAEQWADAYRMAGFPRQGLRHALSTSAQREDHSRV
jgi:23S rRNA (adenine-N6)-dimethyltransferase